jgi:hypothetical protein
MVGEAQNEKKNSHGGGSTNKNKTKKNFQPLSERLTPFTNNAL